MQNDSLNFRLEVYEGPLDLLLSLILKNKLNIYDIPISLILEQYMDYIYSMRDMNMDIAGEFIDMASRLMLIKSKMLLPRPSSGGKEEDPRAPLVDALLEYQKAKENAIKLKERFESYSGRFIKETDEVGIDRSFVSEHDIGLLIAAFERIEIRQKENRLAGNPEAKATLDTILHKKITPVSERLFFILRYLYRRESAEFEELLLSGVTRSDIIASFAAILQLIRAGRIFICREDGNGKIYFSINRKVHSA